MMTLANFTSLLSIRSGNHQGGGIFEYSLAGQSGDFSGLAQTIQARGELFDHRIFFGQDPLKINFRRRKIDPELSNLGRLFNDRRRMQQGL